MVVSAIPDQGMGARIHLSIAQGSHMSSRNVVNPDRDNATAGTAELDACGMLERVEGKLEKAARN